MISIIVPIYNVEPYLRRCLSSIINQSYRDLEILLIDDCSPDKCGEICEEYAKQDCRICVFHNKTNCGLSVTRNIGLDKARGEWLMFVDPDDWVEPNFCSIPYLIAVSEGADLVIFKSRVWKNGRIRRRKSKKKNSEFPTEVVSRELAVELGGPVVWNKLYRRELFENVRYPEGRVHEDIATTHITVFQAKKIVMISNILYNHMIRPNSISQIASEKNRRDWFISVKEQWDFIRTRGCCFEKMQYDLWNASMGFLFRVKSFTDSNETVRQAESIISSIPGYPPNLKLRKRIMLAIWRKDRKLFHFMCWMFGMKRFR